MEEQRARTWRASEMRPAPRDEPWCQPEDTPNYVVRARRECRAYINQLLRIFGQPPSPGRFVIDRRPGGESGNVVTVVDSLCVTLWVDADDPEAVAYSERCVANPPSKWDEEARRELDDLVAEG